MPKKLLIAAGLMVAATAAQAADTYVVGMTATATGRGSGTYAPVVAAFNLYVDKINAAGGINGNKVKLVVADNKGDPSKAAADVKKMLLQDNAVLVINASLSSTFAPIMNEAKRAGAPVLFAGAVCPQQVYPKAEALFFCSTSFGARFDSQFALDFVKGQAGNGAKIGFSAMAIPISRGEIDYAEKLSAEMGLKPVAKEIIPPPTANYAPHATKIKSAGADWAYSWAPWVTQVKTFEALRTLGWTGGYIAYSHINAEEELARIKDDKFFVFGTNALFQDGLDIHKEIAAAAKAGGATYPATQLAEGWIGAMVLEAILKGTPKSDDRAGAQKAMSALKVDFRGLRGADLEWTADNHFRTVQAYRVYRWDSAKGKVVQVTDWAKIDVK